MLAINPEEDSPVAGPAVSPLAACLRNPDLLRLFDYWRSKRGGRLMPARQDIDPLEIGWALSRIFLMDYTPEQGFVYRLAGAEISKVFERSNLKGLTLRDVVKPGRWPLIEGAWRKVVEGPSVVCMTGMVYYGVDRTSAGERLLLPLADEADGPVTGVLGMTVTRWLTDDVPEELKQAKVESRNVSEIE